MWIIGAGEAAKKPAASAASPDSIKFQAVIKLAASAASRKPKSREGSSRGVQDDGSQRTHKGLTEDPQRTHRGLAEDSQRA